MYLHMYVLEKSLRINPTELSEFNSRVTWIEALAELLGGKSPTRVSPTKRQAVGRDPIRRDATRAARHCTVRLLAWQQASLSR